MASPFIFELLKKETAERRELNIAYSDEAKPGPLGLHLSGEPGQRPGTCQPLSCRALILIVMHTNMCKEFGISPGHQSSCSKTRWLGSRLSQLLTV